MLSHLKKNIIDVSQQQEAGGNMQTFLKMKRASQKGTVFTGIMIDAVLAEWAYIYMGT